jgi:putative oxidoreductase
MKLSLLNAIPELISRLTIGSVFIESGWGKIHSMSKVVAYFESLNIPLAHVQAPFVSAVELAAGLFVLLGLFTRWSSLPIIGIMLVAIGTAKWEDVTNFSSLLGLSESLYIVILLWLAAFGSKMYSIDALISKFKSSNLSA